MERKKFEQVKNTMEEYYQALKSNLNAIKNLALAIPKLTSEDKRILEKVKAHQPLEEVVAEFEEIKKWKKNMKGATCIYTNAEKEILVNNEFVNFLRPYRDEIDEEILQQISKNDDITENMDIYTKYNVVIRELTTHNNEVSKMNNDISLNINKKSISYTEEKHKDNINRMRFIKELSNTYSYRNNSHDPFIKVKDEYINILNEATKEMNELEKELNKDS